MMLAPMPATPLFRTLRAAPAPASVPSAVAPSTPTVPGARETYDAKGVELPDGELGTLARSEGDPAVSDAPIDQAHDNAGIVRDFYKQVLGRDSLDGAGMALKSTAHYGKAFNNAFWDGTHMTYGDGDGKTFSPLSGSLDVVAHEMTHGVTERTAKLAYENQSGALNESWSDVMAELVEQWHRDKGSFSTPEGAAKADWLIGEDVFTPGTDGDALRSMKAPGTAYAEDPQPAHMKDYDNTTQDNGGVHINSGIPNKAAYEVAVRIGGEKLAKIWYQALTNHLEADSGFQDAANGTLLAATELFKDGPEVQAVRDAWLSVGLTAAAQPDEPRPPITPSTAKNPGIVPPWFRS